MHPNVVEQSQKLLRAGDPSPAKLFNGSSASPIVLVCEHAGRAIPATLGDLGVSSAKMDDHIAYDIGAEKLALYLAEMLDAPLVLQPYSRLVVDCNRPFGAPDAIPAISDSVAIPGNKEISSQERGQRFDEIFNPYHDAITDILDQAKRSAVFSIHSFTPKLASEPRPWDISFLFRKDTKTSSRLAKSIKHIRPDLTVGMNEPYSIEDNSDWFVPVHGEKRGLAHSLIEVRNDHLRDDNGCKTWAELLAKAMRQFNSGVSI